MTPNFKEEKKLFKKGYGVIIGVDEVGRGPLAGPVTAVAIGILKISNFLRQGRESSTESGQFLISKTYLKGIRDSKKLSSKKREGFYDILTRNSKINWAVASVSAKVIDKINIQEATELAMKRAIKKLKIKPSFLLVDGNRPIKNLDIPQKTIIKGDEKVFLLAAASIIAKVTRDRKMLRYYKKYPQYGFDKHKGYGTKLHFKMLKKYGFCKIHRRSFRPIKHLK
ncbi:MAG TPA: ribonuclease HII [Candidatus Andersenbacteria bacterium]|nr:ribonuclease HII [Candidatus Andersenbacteria bacterium]